MLTFPAVMLCWLSGADTAFAVTVSSGASQKHTGRLILACVESEDIFEITFALNRQIQI